MKVILGPLESEVALVLSGRRGISVNELVAGLLREEAAIEVTKWRGLLSSETSSKPSTLESGVTELESLLPSADESKPVVMAPAPPEPAEVAHDPTR